MNFKEKYPNCSNLPETYLAKYLGNGECDWGLTIHGSCHQQSTCGRLQPNSKECGWDDGDCLNYNEYLVKYADCDGYFSSLGDGICNKFNNNKKCGWDAGDCLEFNKKYPKCRAHPDQVGNGVCNKNRKWQHAINTKECGFDGGDCKIHNFKRMHPDCKVDDYTKIGNGKCDKDLNGYNSKACGWDDGDCLSPGDITGIVIGSLFFVVFATCLYFYREKICTKIEQFRNFRQRFIERHQQRMDELQRQRATVVFPSAPVMAINEEEPRMDRHTLVLTSIIHKKVVSSTTKSNNGAYQVNILPHETILSERSIRITKCLEMHLHVEDKEDVRKHNEEEDEREDLEAQQSILHRKRDIIVEFSRSCNRIFVHNDTFSCDSLLKKQGYTF